MRLGEYFKLARKRRMLSLAKAAQAITIRHFPCSTQRLWDIEHEYRRPSEELLEALCSFYELDLDYALYLMGKLPARIVALELEPHEVRAMYKGMLRSKQRRAFIPPRRTFIPPQEWRSPPEKALRS